MDRQNLKQKGFLTIFMVGLILCSVFPGSAADSVRENEPEAPGSDTIEFETIAFSLALPKQNDNGIFSLFTLANEHRFIHSQNFSSHQIEENIPPKILKGVPKKSDRLENSLYTASLLMLTALNVADYISTVKALQLPGLEEGNPIMRPFTKNILLFGTVKLGITALDFYLLKNIYKKNKTLGWVLSIVGNLAMSYIVSNNIRKIQSVSGR